MGSRAFGGAYDGVSASERPVYGTINLTNADCGVRACAHYGPSYLVLKDSVRWRCTLTDRDSSEVDAKGAVEVNFAHFFRRFQDHELKAIATHTGSYHLDSWPEIQIHGDVLFKRDISKVAVHSSVDSDVRGKISSFCECNS